jgi:hypothetical protein
VGTSLESLDVPTAHPVKIIKNAADATSQALAFDMLRERELRRFIRGARGSSWRP